MSLSIVFGILFAGTAAAEIQPSAGVLLPYFEVGLEPNQSLSTLFAVCNGSDQAADVLFTVSTNWGIPVLTLTQRIAPDAVLTVNLRDWLLYGRLPDRTLSAAELAHVQAALAGEASPSDGLYYGTRVAAGLAVGSITIYSMGVEHRDVLWGDYIIADPAQTSTEETFQSDTLVSLDPTPEADALCIRHAVRFLEAGPFDDGTELIIWTNRRFAPSPTPEPLFGVRLGATAGVYDEPGRHVEDRGLELLPVQTLRVSSLHVTPGFGWFDIRTDGTRSFIGVHYTSTSGHGASLHSYCLPQEEGGGPSIHLEKSVNGEPADDPPGPSIPIDTPITWEYAVTNTGDVPLTQVRVTDDSGPMVSCPRDTLAPDEAMVCTAHGVALACQNRNVGRAEGLAPDGTGVNWEDAANYWGAARAAIEIETRVDGEDADSAPGPRHFQGDAVNWTYEVTNSGEVNLTRVSVSDDQGLPVTCPKTSLVPHETMTCTASGTAGGPGVHRNVGTAIGHPACGEVVSAADPANYHVPGAPGIFLRKTTNGVHAETAPGPTINVGQAVTWSYEVTNIGEVALTGITVTDDRGVHVTCPKAQLSPGEAMVCTGAGIATACQYTNLGTAAGTPSEGPHGTVTSQDPSYYFGQAQPAVTLRKSTNGQDANEPPGPTVTLGDLVQWTYQVTNTGNVTLTGVAVSDDAGVAVSCPKTTLAPAESMTCTASGAASVRGQHRNVGTAVGTPPCGSTVAASDPSNHLVVVPDIALEKLINGQDADTPPGLAVAPGTALLWSYVATNTGDVALTSVTVTDDQHLAVSCPKTTLAAGESMTCTATGTAQSSGTHCNIGTAGATSPQGVAVTASDPSCYTAATPGDEGCTPGYWKNHTDSWAPTGYSTTQHLDSVFAEANHYPSLADTHLWWALAFGGGPGTTGAAEILFRAAVAALLNAAHPSVDYPLTTAAVITQVDTALASENRDAMLALAAQLDAYNNLGCPLH